MVSTNSTLRQKGGSSLMAIFFVSLFAVLSLSFVSMSQVNLNMSTNHQDMSSALAAAESGLEYAKLLVNTYVPPDEALTAVNTVSETDAQNTFGYFVDHLYDTMNNSDILGVHDIYYNEVGFALQVPDNGGVTLANGGQAQFVLNISLSAVDGDYRIVVLSTGVVDDLTRQVQLSFPVQKDQRVLEYAIASRGRIWVTGDTTVHGDVYSDWSNLAVAPFNMTDDSTVEGTLNTVISHSEVEGADWQMETWDENGDEMFDIDGNRVYSAEDEVQGYHEGINYGQYSEVPGMDISDYDTDGYKAQATYTIPSSSTIQTEYFPHVAGDYTQPSSYYSRTLNRHVYENITITNGMLDDNRNALFKNCTFEGVLYIDVNKSTSSKYNNVRFDDCTFNGPIVTDVPQQLKWKHNALYFTGSATFQNSSLSEATVLAPHFNVNLGNANPIDGESNTLTGAIIGGIVDVRGHADVYGTIISMADTSSYTSGYVTNIGATLGDGGSETTQIEDVGTLTITPDPDNLLPSGITTPVVISPADSDSYVEL